MHQSGFVTFKSMEQRDEFAVKLFSRNSDIREKCFLSGLRPKIILESLTEDERDEVQRHLDSNAEWFDDVMFETSDD